MNIQGVNVRNKVDSVDSSITNSVINKTAEKVIKSEVKKQQETVTKSDTSKGYNTKKNKLLKEDYEEIEKLKEGINKTLKVSNRELQYSIHDKLNEIMIKLIDTETNEIIREFPQEKNLDVLAKMLEFSGLLLDEKR